MDDLGHKLDQRIKIKVHEHDPVRNMHDYNIDMMACQLYLIGEEMYGAQFESAEPGVEYAMANTFIRNMNLLMRVRDDEPILIHMKTCGGDWQEGIAIFDLIKACPNPVTILNYTHARSMSSIIFQAANKRVMMPHSYFMLHDGTNGFEGTVKSFNSYANFCKQTDEQMMKIYIDRMKRDGKFKRKSRNWINDMLRSEMDRKEEVYLDAKTTVEWGLADEVFGSDGSYNWEGILRYTDHQLEVF